MKSPHEHWVSETATGWQLRFPAPHVKRLSMNDRLHWARAREIGDVWRDAACWWATANKLPKGLPACELRVTFPVKDRRRRDSDNPAPTVKRIVDGLVLAGVWPDDTPNWVETLGSRFEVGARVVVVDLVRR